MNGNLQLLNLASFPTDGLVAHFDANYGVITGENNSVISWIDKISGLTAEAYDVNFAQDYKLILQDSDPSFQNYSKSGIYFSGNSFLYMALDTVPGFGNILIPSDTPRTFVIIGKFEDPINNSKQGLINDGNFFDKHYIYKRAFTDKFGYEAYPSDYTTTWTFTNSQGVQDNYFVTFLYHPINDGIWYTTGYLRVNGTTSYFDLFDKNPQDVTDLFIGTRNSVEDFLKGEINSVLIYNKELNEQEIESIEILFGQKDCSNFYTVDFDTYNYPSRLVILTGEALNWNGAGGTPDYTNLGCDCVTGDKSCPELDNLQHGIGIALDTSCILTEGVTASYSVNLPSNNIPIKYLVIPDCNNDNTSPENAKWDLDIYNNCDYIPTSSSSSSSSSSSPPPEPPPPQGDCSEYYNIIFKTFDAPSRLIILTGTSLVWNGAGGTPDYTNLGCDCITGDKSCPELDNLQHGIGKVVDTNCQMFYDPPFSGNVYIPSTVPHKVIVIPDCLDQNSDAKWDLQISSGCVAYECVPCNSTTCSFNFNINFSTQNIESYINDFSLLTSHYNSSDNNILKVYARKGSETYYKNLGFIIKQPEYKSFNPGVKWIKSDFIGQKSFYFSNDSSLRVIQNDQYILDETSTWLNDSGKFKEYNLDIYPTGVAGKIFEVSPASVRASALRYGNEKEENYTLFYESDNAENNIYKQEILIKDFGNINTGVEAYYSFNSGWATYDCKTGVNLKNLFSWAVQFADIALLSPGSVLIENGSNLITGSEDVIDKYIKEGMPPILYSGTRGAFDNLNAFCINPLSCPVPPPPEAVIECWTGNNIYDENYRDWFSGILEKYQSNTENFESSQEGQGLFEISEISINRTWEVLTGYIQYNNVVSGDSFKFKLYPFDYTGLYKQLHLNNDPLYPQYEFELKYPEDWTTLSGLVEKLNEKLSPPFSWPVWYPYYCLSGTPTGIYISGALARFWENTGSCCLPDPSGQLSIFDYKNRIDFEALRSFPILPRAGNTGESGQKNWFYDISLELYTGNRRSFEIYSGYSYLVPNEVELQRYKNNIWETIYKENDFYNQITGLERTPVPIGNLEVDGLDRLINGEWLTLLSGEIVDPLTNILQPSENSGVYRTLYRFAQNKIIDSDNCPAQISSLPIQMIWPEGFPSVIIDETGGAKFVDNTYWCQPDLKPPEEDEGPCDLCESGSPILTGCLPPNIIKYDDKGCCSCEPAFAAQGLLFQIRTGWRLTGSLGENALSDGDADMYRVVLRNFSGVSKQGIKQVNAFHVPNINLYGLQSYSLPVMESQEECLIGQNFSIDVQGLVGKKIDSEYNYTITKDMQGQFDINGLVVKELIPEDQKIVTFNKATGYVLGNYYTGIYDNTLKPSGFACHVFDDYFFYNRYKNEISLSQTACEYTKIATGIRRTYEIIKPSVINKELLVGGKFNSPIAFVYVTESGYFSSIIENVVYKEYDLLGYYPFTGIVSGNTVNGKLDINKNLTGFAYTTDEVYPYYPVPTGETKATGFIKINNLINNFDYLSINNTNIIYHTDSSLYTSPGYFNNLETLNNIINESTGVFLTSGVIDEDKIILTSLLLGSDGNTINLFTSNSGIEINGLNLEGGAYFYPKIYRYFYVLDEDEKLISGIEVLPVFTGDISKNILATGFYYNNLGSGFITGGVPTYLGTRTFTGVWGLQSGQDNDYENFLGNNWVNGDKYINSGLFEDNFNLLQLSVRYDNELFTDEENISDVAELKIVDKNYNLVYPTGNIFNTTGEIIFRITGIKNL